MKGRFNKMEDTAVRNNSEPSNSVPTVGKGLVIAVALFVIVLIVGILSVYFSNFNSEFGTQSDFGAFGDFLGGTLNPILSFATLSLLIWSINIQVRELKATTAEFKRSATAQEAIDKNQKQELQFYKKKSEIEFILSELIRLDSSKNEILESSYSDFPINEVIKYGKAEQSQHLQDLMNGFNYSASQHPEEHFPIIHLITDLISYTNDYDYYLEQLFDKKEYELYMMKVYGFASLLERLSAIKLGTKMQLNGLANRIDTRNTKLPDLEDDRLNGLRAFVAERVINVYKFTESINW